MTEEAEDHVPQVTEEELGGHPPSVATGDMGEGCPQLTIEGVRIDSVTDKMSRSVREMKDRVAVETDLERGNMSVKSTLSHHPTKLGQDRHNHMLRVTPKGIQERRVKTWTAL